MIRDNMVEQMGFDEIRKKVSAIDVMEIDVEFDDKGIVSLILISANKTDDIVGGKCHYRLSDSATKKLLRVVKEGLEEYWSSG